MVSLPLPSQPTRNFIVIHYIVGNQGFPVVDEYHAPLEFHSDFVRMPGQLAQSQTAMLMRIAKSPADFRNRLVRGFPHIQRQLVRRSSDSFGEQDANHNRPAKRLSLPALRSALISAKAESSAAVACARVTPYSSNTGKSPGRKASRAT